MYVIGVLGLVLRVKFNFIKTMSSDRFWRDMHPSLSNATIA